MKDNYSVKYIISSQVYVFNILIRSWHDWKNSSIEDIGAVKYFECIDSTLNQLDSRKSNLIEIICQRVLWLSTSYWWSFNLKLVLTFSLC